MKLNSADYECEFRDISKFSFFMRHKDLSPAEKAFATNLTPTSAFQKLIDIDKMQKRKLKDLAAEYLNARIQQGHHSSIIDARVALALYRTYQ